MQVVQDQEEHCPMCSSWQKGAFDSRRRVLLWRYVRIRLLDQNCTLITHHYTNTTTHAHTVHCTLPVQLYTTHTDNSGMNFSYKSCFSSRTVWLFLVIMTSIINFDSPAFILDWPKYFTFVCNLHSETKKMTKIVKHDLYIYSVHTHHSLTQPHPQPCKQTIVL